MSEARSDTVDPRFADGSARAAARHAQDLLTDPGSADLLVALADGVLVPQDIAVAARRHGELAEPAATAGVDVGGMRAPWARRLAGRFDALSARVSPRRTVEQVTTRLREIAGAVATGAELGDDLALLAEAGLGADVTVVGLPGTGPSSGVAHAAALRSLLLTREDLRRVTVDLADLVPEVFGAVAGARDALGDGVGTRYDLDDAAARVLDRTRPLLRAARESTPTIEVTFTAPDDAVHLTVAAVGRAALEPEFLHQPIGVRVAAAPRPRATEALDTVLALATERRRAGGGPLGLRLGAPRGGGADEAAGRGDVRAAGAVTAHLERLLTPEVSSCVTLTLETDDVDLVRRAREEAAAHSDVAAPRALLSPSCPPQDAVALAREGDTAQAWVLAAGAEPDGPDPLPVATARVITALAAAAGSPAPVAGAHRPAAQADPALAEVRAAALDRRAVPAPAVAAPPVDAETAAQFVAACRAAAVRWAARPATDRGRALDRAADLVQDQGGSLTAAAGRAAGLSRLDAEIAEAVDILRVLARGAQELDAVEGAGFEPDRLVLAVTDAGSPVVGPLAALGGALAAGASCVLVVPPSAAAVAQQAAHLVRQALADAEAPGGLVRVVVAEEPPTALLASDEVDTVLVDDPTRAGDVEGLRATRPGGPRVLRRPTGPGVAVVTPAADPEAAAADVLASAFGRGGRAPGATSLLVLVGSVAGPGRFRTALEDGLGALGAPPALDREPSPELEGALTSLEPGEEWVRAPRRLDDRGLVWAPGARSGLSVDSPLAVGRPAGDGAPVLGILAVSDLDAAIAVLRRRPGPVVTLHSLDEEEIARVEEACPAPVLAINRPAPGGGARGHGAAAATGSALTARAPLGVDAVAALGTWRPEEATGAQDQPADPVRRALMDYTGLVTVQAERSWLRAAVGSDAFAFARTLARRTETARLASQDATLRWRPGDVWVRAGAGTEVVELLRVLLAAECVGAGVRLSLCPELSDELKAMDSRGEPARAGLRRMTPMVDRVEDASSFAARVRSGTVTGIVRVLGADAEVLPGLVGGQDVDLVVSPVLAVGRRELVTLLRPRVVARSRSRGGWVSRAG